MAKLFNANSLEKLIHAYQDDAEALEMIYDILRGFEEYHTKIFEMELKLKMYSVGKLELEEYQSIVTELDKRRTMQHNSVLTGVNVLNRMAEQCGIEPIYSGTVSKERPYRREVANAILDFLQTVINNRR